MVFLLAVPVTLALAAMGAGALLGTLGSIAGGLNVEPGQVQQAAREVADQVRQATGGNVGAGEAATAAQAARTAAWGALVASLLGLGAAALGGACGTRRTADMDAMTARAETQ